MGRASPEMCILQVHITYFCSSELIHQNAVEYKLLYLKVLKVSVEWNMKQTTH